MIPVTRELLDYRARRAAAQEIADCPASIEQLVDEYLEIPDAALDLVEGRKIAAAPVQPVRP